MLDISIDCVCDGEEFTEDAGRSPDFKIASLSSSLRVALLRLPAGFIKKCFPVPCWSWFVVALQLFALGPFGCWFADDSCTCMISDAEDLLLVAGLSAWLAVTWIYRPLLLLHWKLLSCPGGASFC
ncbi:hypothetical protein NDU88_005356 [Pleurodeles waltl]|uniref:Uncharacterized protein n=1 Tax=Pleurodeles waltl TaxID=8319 RepID=A0AAV7MAR1_PLEWA|nr:hypothetical protein NDU88_005356 [Pleurodeles waltl]